MIILGIETSCDETSVAVVENGQKVLSNIISSSLTLHQKTGGVIPEIAAREQIKAIIPVMETALSKASKKPKDLDALAVTVGPGLIGSLLVGVETAKTLSVIWNKPIVPVNHLWGHVYANWLLPISNFKFQISNSPKFPLVALVVSGGHTDLVLMNDHTASANALPVRIGSAENVPGGRKHGGQAKSKWLGGTFDDAAGEAFDKIARFLDLGYPGGPAIEYAARNFKFQISNIKFPRPMISSHNFDFSFSGLKTAVVNLVHDSQSTIHSREEIAYEFQQAVVDVLVEKTVRAAEKFEAKEIVVGGGVAANSALRLQLTADSKKIGIPVRFAEKEFCGDNGAMIASAAYFNYKPKPISQIQANPSLHFRRS